MFVEPLLARIFSFSALESRPYAGVSADRPSQRHNDGVVTRSLRGFLFVLDVLHSLDRRLHRSCSRAPPSERIHCPFSIAFCSFTSRVLMHWHFSGCFFTAASFGPSSSVVARPHLSRTSSHIRLTPGHLRRHCYPHQQQFSPISPSPPSVRIPSRVTGLQATSCPLTDHRYYAFMLQSFFLIVPNVLHPFNIWMTSPQPVR